METLLQDLRYAFRALRRSPGFAAVAVLTLALGIGANIAIFSVTQALLWRPIPGVTASEELVAVYTSDFSSGLFGVSSYPDYVDFRDEVGSFRGLAAFSPPIEVNLSAGADEPLRAAVRFVSGNYFRVLGVAPALGRVLTPGDDAQGAPTVVVLAHATWKRRFGADSDLVGRTVRLGGRPVTVVGVAPPGFRGTSLDDAPDLWVSLAAAVPMMEIPDLLEYRGARWLGIVGRLDPGATLAQATAEVRAIGARLAEAYPETNLGTLESPDEPRPMMLVPADEAMSGPDSRRTLERISFLLLGIVGLVLLIACANLANLLLARASGRAREIAVRMSLGAGRRRLARQLVTESLVLALLGGAAGVLLAAWLGDVIIASGLAANFAAPEAVPGTEIDLRVLGFALVLSLAAGLVFGLAPAVRASHSDLVAALKQGDPGSERPGGIGLRDALVVGQVALALLLLVVTGLFVQSLRRTLALDPGFAVERALVAAVDLGSADYEPAEGVTFFEELQARIESIPGVRGATLAQVVPVSPAGSRRGVSIEGYEPRPGEDMELNLNVVGADYFETMRIPLLAGRGFQISDRADAPPVVVVNEEFARRFLEGDVVGGRISFGNPDEPPIEIVGVVATGRYRDLREEAIPYMYLPFAQNFATAMEVVVATDGDPEGFAPQVRAELRALDPDLPLFDVRTLEDHLGGLVATDRAIATLVAAFAVLALFLAALGLYGLLSFLVARRAREIGMRVALGARAGEVRRLFLARGVALTAAGLAIGLVAAALLTRFVSGLLFGVSATDPFVFGITALVLLAVGALAAYAPARRATRVDPMTALRAE
ncbi:MAG: ABC transporter permease [Gemmatimonadota bacterium]